MRENQALRLYKNSEYAKINKNNAVLQRLITLRKENQDGNKFLGAVKSFIEKAKKIRTKGERGEDLKSLYDQASATLYSKPGSSLEKILKAYDDLKMDQSINKLGDDDDMKKQKSQNKQKYMGAYAERDADGKITKTGPRVATKEKQVNVKPVWTIDVEKGGVKVGEINAKELFDVSGKSVLKGDKGTILYKGMPTNDQTATQIAAVQSRLAGLGYLSKEEVDGDFGPKTKSAIEQFQKKFKLSVDGKVGRQTATAMFSDLARKLAKDVPITGKESNDIIAKTVDNLTKDRTKTTSYFEPIERELKLDDKEQRGLSERYVIDRTKVRRLIRESIRRKLR